MPQLGLFLVVIFIAAVVLNIFLQAKPSHMAVAIRRISGTVFAVLAVIFLLRGLVPMAFAAAIASFLAFGFGPSRSGWFSGARKSEGQASRVRSEILAMNLDHDSGELDGDVLKGFHAGRKLSELSLNQLMEVRSDCLSAGDQSTRLLDAYLDRMQAGWRETAGSDEGGEGASEGAMRVQDAYEILGLHPGATKAQIRKAHRELMKKFHPDHGGSEYLARKINEARDLLLSVA
jgi:hypothetical protein